jgi:hypothetical protein
MNKNAVLSHMIAKGQDVGVWCNVEGCGHHGVLDAAFLAGVKNIRLDTPIQDIAQFLACPKCGTNDVKTRPEWSRT